MSSYQAYPEYRNSGVEWLGEIPSHWSTKRLGTFFDERREKVSDKEYPALSVTMKGIVPQLENAAKTDAGDNRKLVKKNDFVINSRSDRKGSSGISKLDGSVSLISIVLQPIRIEPVYTHHLLRSVPFQEEFYKFGKGIVADLWSTNSSEMKNIQIPDVPHEEQQKIANFLDHETAKIDTLIEKQQQLIKLLKEKRQAVISHAVTKGLNPDAPMKDSEVEWLGEVPEEWGVLPLRRLLLNIQQGSSPIANNRPPKETEFGVLKISSVKKGRYLEENSKTLSSEAEFERRFSVKKGDLLMTRANTPELVGDTCFVSFEPKYKIMLCDLVYRLEVSARVLPAFLCFWLLSDFGRLQIEMDARGSSMTMAKISQSHIRSWMATCPTLKEQQLIVNSLDRVIIKYSRTEEKIREFLILLNERRTALISAAVTGKIDVRNWQSPKATSTPSTDA